MKPNIYSNNPTNILKNNEKVFKIDRYSYLNHQDDSNEIFLDIRIIDKDTKNRNRITHQLIKT